ncbi:hypothetical protein NEOLEDRAFT_1069606 [Neolentinus lepideus HHB14362 ss-1]|uniref:Uncharacterized protein n=1 Tax=Neolentinus lepideus HHB14362 ss-1 TaxID=1314782 RepID=A0A165R7G0_9AGAM|nr:hypothetical protein NEOLEDRAFT_1069606 [Neolentinus lepideus HHB14362 ss-1]
MALPDRGYTNLLSHLHRSSTSLSQEALQGAIAYYLASVQPSPTPLSASVISSPLFRPFSHAKLHALSTAFRHAVHLKCQALKKDNDAIFQRSPGARLADWVKATVKGCQGGQAVLRLVCYGGLLLGLEDVKRSIDGGSGREKVENEIVVALAEVMDMYVSMQSLAGWDKEFRPDSDCEGLDFISLALLMMSQFVPTIPSEKLKVLPLDALTSLLMSSISSVYHSGAFLVTLSDSFIRDAEGRLIAKAESSLPSVLHEVTSSPLYTSIAPLSRFCARCLSLLADRRPVDAWQAMARTLETLQSVAVRVESDWVKSPLAMVNDDKEIAPDARDLTTAIWSTLKTLLFTTIMLTQSILSSVLFLTPSRSSPHSPSSLALLSLDTLAHLSFIISQFGSISATTAGGFKELKKTVYTALDVLASDKKESDNLVKGLIRQFAGRDAATLSPPDLAKKSFALVCIEQLVPAVDDDSLESSIFPLCLPQLSSPAHRETYESAHSVVLAILSKYTRRRVHSSFADQERPTAKGKERSRLPSFVEQLIPFYTDCLIENSREGGLTLPQLRLAFSTLATSAASAPDDSLICHCIYSLISTIRLLSQASTSPPAESDSTSDTGAPAGQRLHNLTLSLISMVSALPLGLLPCVLGEIQDITELIYPITAGDLGSHSLPPPREELADALFKEILDCVGDKEKEFTMRWWYVHWEQLLGVGVGLLGHDDGHASGQENVDQ